ncbi:DUF930 domain-containing protein [Mesorhizobium retamae]|uniref:DUF930 domain-containing protein n=1 Tax=Mesorhizobium retamae TaxID=2912854 RepID=A0ABS9QMQ6_9HYPH|nr:DUF930 domain-containing protein [Mesorhizobium sp. IRAMC:0171]MCG7508706.1 DUF930 domain-containing protein [Mesorhizobium sp. IRAMC:0171]
MGVVVLVFDEAPPLRPPIVTIEPIAVAKGAGLTPARVASALQANKSDLRLTVGASCLLHLLLLAGLMLLPIPEALRLPPIESIKVDFVPPPRAPEPVQQGEPVATPEAGPDTSATQPAIQAPLPTPTQPPMIKAEQLYSAQVLADPRSRGARRALPQLAPQERVIQLCNIEALAQLRRQRAGLQPDLVVPYAMEDAKVTGKVLEAKGAAIRSRKHWYGLAFNCEVAPDLKTVVAFEFLLGAEIPEQQWADHNLTLDDGPSD